MQLAIAQRCSQWYCTLQDEMRQGLSYFHETIFEGLPKFLRRIDTALKNIGQPMLPLDHCLFKFGSWCVPNSCQLPSHSRGAVGNILCT
jgi:phosphoenolpyruvate carboxylase